MSESRQARRLCRWAVAEEQVPPVVAHAVAAVENLCPGRSAVESPPVPPVNPRRVADALLFLSR